MELYMISIKFDKQAKLRMHEIWNKINIQLQLTRWWQHFYASVNGEHSLATVHLLLMKQVSSVAIKLFALWNIDAVANLQVVESRWPRLMAMGIINNVDRNRFDGGHSVSSSFYPN